MKRFLFCWAPRWSSSDNHQGICDVILAASQFCCLRLFLSEILMPHLIMWVGPVSRRVALLHSSARVLIGQELGLQKAFFEGRKMEAAGSSETLVSTC